jgi:hypothetical protein
LDPHTGHAQTRHTYTTEINVPAIIAAIPMAKSN